MDSNGCGQQADGRTRRLGGGGSPGCEQEQRGAQEGSGSRRRRRSQGWHSPKEGPVLSSPAEMLYKIKMKYWLLTLTRDRSLGFGRVTSEA
jgi:hypothetical protein